MRELLLAFLADKLRECEREPESELSDATSLLASGLLDSLIVLDLAAWIEQAIGSSVDLSDVTLPDEWDTVAEILAFVERKRGEAR